MSAANRSSRSCLNGSLIDFHPSSHYVFDAQFPSTLIQRLTPLVMPWNRSPLQTEPRRLLCLILLVLTIGCKRDEVTPEIAARSFALGFTYFSHDGSASGLGDALRVISTDADLLVAHFDGGVPWDAALQNDFSLYPQDLQAEISGIVQSVPQSHSVYVAVTPIAFKRDRLAPTRGPDGEQWFIPPWDGYRFDDADVIRAFRNHCRIMVEQFDPDFFAFGIEVNLLRLNVPNDVWNQYLVLAESVYVDLKSTFPSMPVFQTIQVEGYWSDAAAQSVAVSQIATSTDLAALSSYPFADHLRYQQGSVADPVLLPPNYYGAVTALLAGRPFAVAETGWPAEDIGAPYPVSLRSNEGLQRSFLNLLFDEAEERDAEFITWFFSRDYDEYWESRLASLPDSALLRLWKDTGLYDGDGNPRMALAVWRSVLERPRR